MCHSLRNNIQKVTGKDITDKDFNHFSSLLFRKAIDKKYCLKKKDAFAKTSFL